VDVVDIDEDETSERLGIDGSIGVVGTILESVPDKYGYDRYEKTILKEKDKK
jgi:hypothetical protein